MELRTTERLFWSYRKHKANGSRKGRGKKGLRGKGEGCEGKGVGLDDEFGGEWVWVGRCKNSGACI